MYEWLENLEFNLLELEKPDIKVFLYVPYEVSLELKKNRVEALDQHENNKKHLIHAERAYLELSDIYNFKEIDCSKDNKILSIEAINDILYEYIKKELTVNK